MTNTMRRIVGAVAWMVSAATLICGVPASAATVTAPTTAKNENVNLTDSQNTTPDPTMAIQTLVTKVQSNNPGTGNESVDHIRDDNQATKWFEGAAAPSTQTPVYAVYTLSQKAIAYGYTLTSGNDNPDRDPKNWEMLGSNDDSAASSPNSQQWTVLDTQSNQTFASRHQIRGFAVAKPTAYKYYQLRVTAKQGTSEPTAFQLADWTLIGPQKSYTISGLADDTWQYWDTTHPNDPASDPTTGSSDRTSWADSTANAQRWKTGSGPFGVKKASDGSDGVDLGDGFTSSTKLTRDLGGSSIVPVYFFRRSFALSDSQLSAIGGLVGRITYDDTATIYVNGARAVGFQDGDVNSNSTPLNFDGAGDPQTALFTIPASMLHAGDNVISVEVHQCNNTSSDAYMDMPWIAATSDYRSMSYSNDETGTNYESNAWPATSNGKDYWVDLLSGFTDLAQHPDVWSGDKVDAGQALTARNDQLVVQINNDASAAQVNKALTDANNSPVDTMRDAYGSHLGDLYEQDLQSGKLPKTAEILGMVTNGIDGHDAAKNTYQEQRPYQRLVGRIDKKNISYGFSNDSFPSGHTTAGYTAGTTLATLLPELAPQMLERTSEYGNNRLVLGFHYPIDVMGGRMGAQAMVGYRWSDPKFQQLLEQAHEEMESVLLAQCKSAGYGDTIITCAGAVSKTAEAASTYAYRLTYGFPQIGKSGTALTIPKGAEDLLITKYPNLSDAQRRSIIEQTALDSGYPLDKSNDGESSWQRINLAAALSANVSVNTDGSVTVQQLPSANTQLSSLQVKGVSVDVDKASASDGTTARVANPANTTTEDVRAVAAQPDAKIATAIKSNVVTVVVTAADGTSSHTYTVTLQEDVREGEFSGKVDPFVSTADDDGNDMPGAEAPNGLAKVNPLSSSNRNHSGYNYTSTQISGFTNDNLEGVGGSGGGGDLLVVPTSVAYTKRPDVNSYAHSFSHDSEEAHPGYYGVALRSTSGTDSNYAQADGYIDAEVTAATRTAVHQYAFPAGQRRSIVLDLKNNFTSRIASSLTITNLADGRKAIAGKVVGSFNGPKYTLYYYATTDQPVSSIQSWGDNGMLRDDTSTIGSASQSGVDTGVVLNFPSTDNTPIGLNVTLSPISSDQAKIDQTKEVGSQTFNQVRQATADSWENLLSRVKVSASTTNDPDGSLVKLFYTHLYRTLAVPVNATSTSGTYRGVDGAVHQANGYVHYDGWSGWDDFRKFSVIAYLYPEIYRNMVQSLINLFADTQAAGGDKTPDQLMQAVPTVRFERSAVIIADALSKGYTGFGNLAEAYPALRRLVGSYSATELKQGYISDHPGDSVMRGYDDWAMSIIATRLNKGGDAQDYAKQAELPIANQFKPGAWTAADGTKVNVLSSRNANGDFGNDNLEAFQAANVYQGTLWQYNWYDAYDMAGMTKAMGGQHAMQLALSHMFGEDAPDNGSGMLHSNANEVDLQTPYLFNSVNEPSKTQQWVRTIYASSSWNRYIATSNTDEYPSGNGEFTPPIKTSVYQLSPRGFLPTMDNDAGTMSSAFVAAAIGLYPVNAGSSQYEIGTPFFDAVTIRQDDGRTFTINAKGASSSNFYVGGTTLNGKAYDNTWLDYGAIAQGGTMDFSMQSTPSTWGTHGQPAYSLSDGGGPESSSSAYRTTIDRMSVDADEQGSVSGTFTITLPEGISFNTDEAVRADPMASGALTADGLPSTVKATARITSNRVLTVTLQGTATAAASFHLTLGDRMFADGIPSSSVSGPGLTLQEPLTIQMTTRARESLQQLIGQAQIEQNKSFTSTSFAALTNALQRARQVMGDDNATTDDVQRAHDALQGAIDGLQIHGSALRVLQGESSDAWSGGSLSNEAYHSDGDLGGVADGAWVQYNDMDFSQLSRQQLSSISIRVADEYGSSDDPSTVDVHAGGVDGPVVATVTLPGTSGFDKYQTVAVDLDQQAVDTLKSASSVTFSFHAPKGRQWVGNFDWFQFGTNGNADQTPAVLEGEQFTTKGGSDSLGTETDTWNDGTKPVVLKGTKNGDFLRYDDFDFGDTGKTTVKVHYVNNSSRCGSNSGIELYLDPASDTDLGTPFATIPLPVTGSDWNTSGTTAVTLPKAISGKHTVALRLVTTADDSHPYVANIDNLTFSPTVEHADTQDLKTQIGDAHRYVEERSRYTEIDYKAFDAELTAAQQLVDSQSAPDASQVYEQTYRLAAAIRQLTPQARLQLDYDVQQAKHLDEDAYVARTWKTFEQALNAAATVLGNESSSDQQLSAADQQLIGAQNALVLLAQVTVPSVPQTVKATVNGGAVTISWQIPSSDGYADITGYDIQVDNGALLHVGAQQRSLIVENLVAGDHAIRVRAANAKGTGNWSSAVHIRIDSQSNNGGDGAGDEKPGTADGHNGQVGDGAVNGVAVDHGTTGNGRDSGPAGLSETGAAISVVAALLVTMVILGLLMEYVRKMRGTGDGHVK